MSLNEEIEELRNELAELKQLISDLVEHDVRHCELNYQQN
jgi:hypothetical protein